MEDNTAPGLDHPGATYEVRDFDTNPADFSILNALKFAGFSVGDILLVESLIVLGLWTSGNLKLPDFDSAQDYIVGGLLLASAIAQVLSLASYYSHLLLLHTDFGLEKATELFYTFLGLASAVQVVGNFGLFLGIFLIIELAFLLVLASLPLLASDEIRTTFQILINKFISKLNSYADNVWALNFLYSLPVVAVLSFISGTMILAWGGASLGEIFAGPDSTEETVFFALKQLIQVPARLSDSPMLAGLMLETLGIPNDALVYLAVDLPFWLVSVPFWSMLKFQLVFWPVWTVVYLVRLVNEDWDGLIFEEDSSLPASTQLSTTIEQIIDPLWQAINFIGIENLSLLAGVVPAIQWVKVLVELLIYSEQKESELWASGQLIQPMASPKYVVVD